METVLRRLERRGFRHTVAGFEDAEMEDEVEVCINLGDSDAKHRIEEEWS